MTDLASGHARVVAALKELDVPYNVVRTEPARNAEESAELQGIDLSELLKTIVVRKGEADYVFVLVPADRAIEWKKLRQILGVTRASLPERDEAEGVTGYPVGAITPFGSATSLPVIVDVSALTRERVALGAGERGVNVHLAPTDLTAKLGAVAGDITREVAGD